MSQARKRHKGNRKRKNKSGRDPMHEIKDTERKEKRFLRGKGKLN
jgi:hypothetical protein